MGRTTENIGTVVFFISYILFVMIVLVNVAVAVLLEGFLSSIAQYEQAERQSAGVVEYNKSAGHLDTLLASLAPYKRSCLCVCVCVHIYQQHTSTHTHESCLSYLSTAHLDTLLAAHVCEKGSKFSKVS